MRLFISLIIVLLTILFIFFIYRLYLLTKNIIYPPRDSYKTIEEDLQRRIGYDDKRLFHLLNTPYEAFSLKSTYGYDIVGRFFKGRSKDKCIILLHREGRNLIASYKFLDFYLKLGYSVVMFDSRYHGLSGGKNYTYGYFERWDLKLVTDYISSKFPEKFLLGSHGESGGAATALLNLNIDKRIRFSIADSSFTDLLEVMRILELKFLKTKSKKVLMLINQIIKRRAGYSLENVSPLTEIEALEVPVLFIHSELDSIVPNKMSKTLRAFKSGYSDIYIAKGSTHLMGFYNHREEYEKRLASFLEIMEENFYDHGNTYK